MKRVATHKRPDPDAVVAAWLAERYLFDVDENVTVVFVGRKRPARPERARERADCVVDAWNAYALSDPEQPVFDHKPPAFADRNETCATRLVWEHLLRTGKPVRHLAALVEAVHAGDRNPPFAPGRGGAALVQSRQNGLHAYFARVRPQCASDEQLYLVVRAWLDDFDHATRRLKEPSMTLDPAAIVLEPVADYACNTGEGPLWHPQEKAVYWTDIPAGRLFRYDPATGEHAPIYDGEPVGGMTLQADGNLLLFLARGRIAVLQPGGALTNVVDEIADERETRFNDVIADPAGRVFCGTMPTRERPGRLYRLDLDGSLSIVLEDVGCSNGCGFTPDGTGMYFTDTAKREISLFDYEAETGELTNRRLFVRTPDGSDEGAPDGMTVDAAGNVWSTRWGGSCIVCYAPDGTEKQRVAFPVKKVSSATFAAPGGDDATMYVTTAGGHQKETDGAHAGALFRLRVPGVHGVPEFVSRVGL